MSKQPELSTDATKYFSEVTLHINREERVMFRGTPYHFMISVTDEDGDTAEIEVPWDLACRLLVEARRIANEKAPVEAALLLAGKPMDQA